jgi:ribosomal protein L37AE/L43A
MTKCHQSPTVPVPVAIIRDIVDKYQNQKWKCNICGRTFGSFEGKEKHLKSVHGVEGDEFECGECGEDFIVKRLYETHLRGHEAETGTKLLFTCFCTLKFTSEKELWKHEISHRHLCEIEGCGEVFPNNHELNVHFKAVHMNMSGTSSPRTKTGKGKTKEPPAAAKKVRP